jgi:hypothetical protein
MRSNLDTQPPRERDVSNANPWDREDSLMLPTPFARDPAPRHSFPHWRPRPPAWVLWVLSLAGLLGLCGRALGGSDLLIRHREGNRESGIYEKVVVTGARATISRGDSPDPKGEPIEPFAIFFKLRTPSGRDEENGYLRVGTATGKPLGWIRRADAAGKPQVADWNTRFVLEPRREADREFQLALPGPGSNFARLTALPDGKLRMALVTDEAAKQGDDQVYPVIVFAGNTQSEGTRGALARERNQIEDLKLELVFVLESTDFMTIKYDEVVLVDAIKGLVRDAIDAIRAESRLTGAVRIGIVEYQDSTPKAHFVSRLTCPLTADLQQVAASLDRLDPVVLADDWPDDVIAGLNLALEQAGWSDNSSKHIILIGMASCQLDPRGRGQNQYGFDRNSVTHRWERSADNPNLGFNHAGLSLSDLISRANPVGSSPADQARKARTFHAALAGRNLPALPGDAIEMIDKIVRSDDATIQKFYEYLVKDGGKSEKDASSLINLMFGYHLANHQRNQARAQYQELARNNNLPGMFLEVEPTSESVRAAVEKVRGTLKDAFETLVGAREQKIGEDELRRNSNAITKRYYTLVGAAAAKFKDEATLSGTARLHDDNGREVAQEKVLVSFEELKRLKESFDEIHETFKARVPRDRRQDVTAILEDLKRILVAASTGQEVTIGSDVKLKDMITDLPLRTKALEVTAGDIAVMPNDAFEQWLSKIETAEFRAQDLLDGKTTSWLELSPLAANEKFTFLRKNDLP